LLPFSTLKPTSLTPKSSTLRFSPTNRIKSFTKSPSVRYHGLESGNHVDLAEDDRSTMLNAVG
jgi:hypothetical protein